MIFKAGAVEPSAQGCAFGHPLFEPQSRKLQILRTLFLRTHSVLRTHFWTGSTAPEFYVGTQYLTIPTDPVLNRLTEQASDTWEWVTLILIEVMALSWWDGAMDRFAGAASNTLPMSFVFWDKSTLQTSEKRDKDFASRVLIKRKNFK